MFSENPEDKYPALQVVENSKKIQCKINKRDLFKLNILDWV